MGVNNMNNKDKILLYVPARNTEKTIISVLNRINKLKFPYHVVLVDNHSKDKTVMLAREYIKKNNFDCTIIKNVKDEGYGGSNKIAWWYGINNGFDYMTVLHSDAQYPIEYSGKLIEAIKNTKSHVVIGSRLTHKSVQKSMPSWRRWGNEMLSRFDRWAFSLNLSEFHSEFKIYDLNFLKKINIDKVGNRYHLFSTWVELLKHGVKVTEISIPCYYPKESQHPGFFDLIGLVGNTLYRGLRYKLFNK